MGLFGKKNNSQTKCDVCNLELPTPERLERHKKKAHGRIPGKKIDDTGGAQSGLW